MSRNNIIANRTKQSFFRQRSFDQFETDQGFRRRSFSGAAMQSSDLISRSFDDYSEGIDLSFTNGHIETLHVGRSRGTLNLRSDSNSLPRSKSYVNDELVFDTPDDTIDELDFEPSGRGFRI